MSLKITPLANGTVLNKSPFSVFASLSHLSLFGALIGTNEQISGIRVVRALILSLTTQAIVQLTSFLKRKKTSTIIVLFVMS